MNVIPFKPIPKFKIKTTKDYLIKNNLLESYKSISGKFVIDNEIDLTENQAILLGLLKWG